MLEADRPNNPESAAEDAAMPVTHHLPVQNTGGPMKPRWPGSKAPSMVSGVKAIYME
jgi:hypothetical protein